MAKHQGLPECFQLLRKFTLANNDFRINILPVMPPKETFAASPRQSGRQPIITTPEDNFQSEPFMPKAKGFLEQFMHLSLPFWNSEHKASIRVRTLALVALTILQIVIAVIITAWSAALFDALEQHSMSGLLKQIGLLILIFAANIAVTGTHLSIKRGLQIDWRDWLTHHVNGRWMHNGRHYLVTHIEGAHDNPDGRIAEDIRIATEDAITLCHSLFYSLLMLISFAVLLWQLSGTVFLNLWLVAIPIEGHLVWIALIYAIAASVLGWWIGQPLVKATDTRQTMEANFRFALATAREHAQPIALIRGECSENNRFHRFFGKIILAFQEQTIAWRNILMFSSGYAVLSMAFPILVSAPRYIFGSITLGALMQSAQAFQHMVSALSWPVDNMPAVAQWRASVQRVLGLLEALDNLEAAIARPDPNRIVLEKLPGNSLRFENLRLTNFSGDILIDRLDTEIKPGERVLIDADSGLAAKLFKAIAGLWPWGNGRIGLPDDEPMFFMPPRPYLPESSLREAISYPSCDEPFPTETLEELLRLVDLGELIPLLDTVDTWDKSLSRAQQQRLGLVRLLLYKPKWVLLEESFDSLDPEGEVTMLQIICKALPNVTLITVTNQPTAESFHERRLTIRAV